MAPNVEKTAGGGTVIVSYENDDAELIPSLRKKGYRTTLILHVNGSRVPPHLARLARPHQTLLSFLRDVLRLTGSKLGCGEGGCGACTVMISRYVPGEGEGGEGGRLDHRAVNACLFPALAADGCHVTSVEGVGTIRKGKDSKDGLHPIQRAMVDMHGSQVS